MRRSASSSDTARLQFIPELTEPSQGRPGRLTSSERKRAPSGPFNNSIGVRSETSFEPASTTCRKRAAADSIWS